MKKFITISLISILVFISIIEFGEVELGDIKIIDKSKQFYKNHLTHSYDKTDTKLNDKVIFYIASELDVDMSINGISDITNKQSQYYYLYGQKKHNSNSDDWRLAIQQISKDKKPLNVPLSYIDVTWSKNKSIKGIDLLDLSQDNPYFKFSDILNQFSYNDNEKKLDLTINESPFKYQYFEKANRVNRKLLMFDKKSFKHVDDEWSLVKNSNHTLGGIDSLNFKMKTESKGKQSDEDAVKLELDLMMLLKVEAVNVTDKLITQFPTIDLNSKKPNYQVNNYFLAQHKQFLEQSKINSKADALQKLKTFIKKHNYKEFKNIGKFVLDLELNTLVDWLNSAEMSETEQAYLIHSLDYLDSPEAFSRLRTLLNSDELSSTNRYRAMISLTKQTPQNMDNYQSIESIALSRNIDPALQHNAAIQMVTIGREMGAEQLRKSLNSLAEYSTLPNAKKDAYLLAMKQSGDVSAYKQFIKELHPGSKTSVVGRSAIADMIVGSALQNDHYAAQVLTDNYLTENNAQVISKYNDYFSKNDIDTHYAEQMYQKIVQSTSADERKARMDALTHNQKACTQHKTFLKSYVNSTNVDKNNVSRVLTSCSNI